MKPSGTIEIYNNLYKMINEHRTNTGITDYLKLEEYASCIVYLNHFDLELTDELKETIINELIQDEYDREDIEYDILNDNTKNIINFYGENVCLKVCVDIALKDGIDIPLYDEPIF